ncbi:MAG TPA: InlB B-repeat-containing protein [Syntrophomonadaceae bacterium]|nr:InlB B-repeat-containing protein [Syntrophomonadaceae bacterium]
MVRTNKWSIVFMLVVLAALGPGIGLSAVSADSSTITWTAAGNGDWGAAGNWDLGRVPGTGDHVIIPAGVTVTISSTGTYDMDSIDCDGTLSINGGTVSISANMNVNTLSISGGSATFNCPAMSVNTINHSNGTSSFKSPSGGINPSAINVSGDTGSIINFDIPVTTAVLNLTATGDNRYCQNCRLGGKGNLLVTKGGTWRGGMQKGGGTITIAAGATINIVNTGGFVCHICGTLENNGTIVSNYNLGFYTGDVSDKGVGIINNNGTFDFQGDYGYINRGGSATFNNNATGIFKKSAGSGTSQFDSAFNNKGSVLVNSGTLSLNGGGSSDGSFQAASGATLNFGGGTSTLSAASSISASNLNVTGGSATFNCASINADAISTSGGAATFNSSALSVKTINHSAGTSNFVNPAGGINPSAVNVSGDINSIIYFNIPVTTAILNLTVNGPHGYCQNSRLGGNGNVTVTGSGTWNGGMQMGGSTITIAAGATINIVNTGSNVCYICGTLVNNGTIISQYDLGVYTNDASAYGVGKLENNGTFDFQGDYGYRNKGGTATFNNNANGIFKKSAGTGTSYFDAAFNNKGSVLVNSGTLSLNGGGNSEGSFHADSGSNLAFGGGTATLSSASSIITPNLNVTGGSVTFNCASINADAISTSGGAATFNSSALSVKTINHSAGTSNFVNPAGGINPSAVNASGDINSIIYFNIPVTTAVLNLTVNGPHGYCQNSRLGGSGNVTVTGSGTWNGGMQMGGSTITIAAGATINIVNAGSNICYICGTLVNNGTVISQYDLGVYTNDASAYGVGIINNNGTFDFQGDYGYRNKGGTATFNNNANGIFKKSAGTGTSYFDTPFNNKGTMLVKSGIISINKTYTQDSTGVLRLDIAGSTTSDNSPFKVSNTATLAGNLDVNLLNSYVPASTDSFTAMTYGSNNGTFNTITNAQGHTFKAAYNAKNLVLQMSDPAPSISGAAISPTSGSAGDAQNVSIAVTTTRVADGTAITANLLDGNNEVKSSVSGTVAGNTANLILAVPSTLAAGSYQVQLVLSGAGNSPYNAGSYTINPAPVTLQSIAITNPASRLVYNVGEELDISGLEVTGTYSDDSKKVETITATDVSGFNSSTAVASQTLTITIGGKTATYDVEIKSAVQTFIVTFVSNGDSSVDPKTVVAGGYVDAPPTPVKSGCTFSGWYFENGTTPFDFANTPISSNITLYGKWMQSGAGGGGESFPIFTALPSYFEQFLND